MVDGHSDFYLIFNLSHSRKPNLCFITFFLYNWHPRTQTEQVAIVFMLFLIDKMKNVVLFV